MGEIPEEFEWSLSHEDRLKNYFVKGFRSDLALVLGEGVVVDVHKIFLQGGSPILDAKIRRCKKNCLVIRNVNPRIFNIMLHYFYTGKLTVPEKDRLELLELAAICQVTELQKLCEYELVLNLDKESSLALLDCSVKNNFEHLKIEALKYICKNGWEVMALDDFTLLSSASVTSIIEKDSLLVMEELQVFHEVCRWGKAECIRQKLDELNINVMRKILEPQLKHVRFEYMEPTQFARHVVPSNLLGTKQTLQLLTELTVKEKMPLMKEMCDPEVEYVPSSPRLYLRGCTISATRLPSKSIYSYSMWKTMTSIAEALMIRCNYSVQLSEIEFPKSVLNTQNTDYSVQLSEIAFPKLVLNTQNTDYTKYSLRINERVCFKNVFVSVCIKQGEEIVCKDNCKLIDSWNVYKIRDISNGIILRKDEWVEITLSLTGRVGYPRIDEKGVKVIEYQPLHGCKFVTNFSKYVQLRPETNLVLDVKHGVVDMAITFMPSRLAKLSSALLNPQCVLGSDIHFQHSRTYQSVLLIGLVYLVPFTCRCRHSKT